MRRTHPTAPIRRGAASPSPRVTASDRTGLGVGASHGRGHPSAHGSRHGWWPSVPPPVTTTCRGKQQGVVPGRLPDMFRRWRLESPKAQPRRTTSCRHCQVNGENCSTRVLSGTVRSLSRPFDPPTWDIRALELDEIPTEGKGFSGSPLHLPMPHSGDWPSTSDRHGGRTRDRGVQHTGRESVCVCSAVPRRPRRVTRSTPVETYAASNCIWMANSGDGGRDVRILRSGPVYDPT